MNTNDIKIFIERVGWSDQVKVWLGYRNNQTGGFSNATVGEKGVLVITEIKEGEEYPPLLTMPRYVWGMLVDAINEQVPNEPKEVVDSELKATKFHLEDLRKMIYEKRIK